MWDNFLCCWRLSGTVLFLMKHMISAITKVFVPLLCVVFKLTQDGQWLVLQFKINFWTCFPYSGHSFTLFKHCLNTISSISSFFLFIEFIQIPKGESLWHNGCSLKVNEFNLQSRYYVYFQTNTFWTGMKPFIPPT